MPSELATEGGRQSHLDAAKTLVLTTVSDEAWSVMIATMADAVITTNPEVRALRPAFDRFFKEFLTREELASRSAALYAEHFTELELRQMIWFYSTPTGKKAIIEMPMLMQASSEIGRQIVEDRSAELNRILSEYIEAHPEAAPRRE